MRDENGGWLRKDILANIFLRVCECMHACVCMYLCMHLFFLYFFLFVFPSYDCDHAGGSPLLEQIDPIKIRWEGDLKEAR